MTLDTIPVALFAYRRPDLLERCLASLRANAVPLIYAFSDGARDAAVRDDVIAVRALLHAVDWTRIEVIAAPQNLGVGTSELRGISHVLDRHDAAVMVEEDLEFVPGTYDFLVRALRHYADTPKAMGVTAWAHPRLTPAGQTQPYFTGRMSSLMWGTWRRAWAGVRETNSLDLLRECAAKGVDVTRFGYDLATPVDNDEARGHWDRRFNLHMLARGGLFLFPATSMVRHTGYDERATNSPNGKGWEEDVRPAPDPAAVRWPAVVEQPGSGDLWRREVGPPPLTFMGRVRRKLRRWLRR
ncbi:MAG TPA: hypothetical protein VG916_03810 [Gemmatimonadaceae bacterium]|nr:hypothetical protein [Gemmatimonadaceae bacterium]